MNHELHESSNQLPVQLVHQESSTEVTKDWAKVAYGVTSYKFQREGDTAKEGPYVSVEMHDTGADTSFVATSIEQHGPDGAASAGPEPFLKLSCEVQDRLDAHQSTTMAALLADVMLSGKLYQEDGQRPRLAGSQQAVPANGSSPAFMRYTFQRRGTMDENEPYVMIDVADHDSEKDEVHFFVHDIQARNNRTIGLPAEMTLTIQAAPEGQQSAAVAERLADLRFRVSEQIPY